MIADTMVSGEWIVTAIKTILLALGTAGATWIVAFKKGKASTSTKIEDPVPEVPVRRVYSPPTFSQHMELHRRVGELEIDVKTMRREQSEQFRRLLEVGEERKDKIFDKIDTMARGFHARVDQIMDERKPKKPN